MFGGRRRKIDPPVLQLGCLKHNFGHFDHGSIWELENKIDGLLYDEEMYWKTMVRGSMVNKG